MKLKYKEDRPHGMMIHDTNGGGDQRSVSESGSGSLDSGSAHGSTTTRSQSVRDDTNASIRKELAKRETRNVLRLRIVVILVLVILATIICANVHRLTSRIEHDEFESQYEAAVEKIIVSFQDIMDRMGSVTGLSMAFTSYGLDHKDETHWPFETLTNFQQKAKHARQLSKALYLGISHAVSQDDFDAWEQYIQQPENQIWIDETKAHQELLGLDGFAGEEHTHDDVHAVTGNEVDTMHYFSEDGHVVAVQPGSSLYLPTWQISPYIPMGLVNEDILMDHYSREIALHVMDSASALIGGFLTAPPGSVNSSNHDTSMFASLRSIQAQESTTYLGDPLAKLFVPIFDGFNNETRKVVGVLTALIHWKSYFHNILPDTIKGVDMVLAYTCGDGFIHDHADASELEDAHDSGHAHRNRNRDLASFTIIEEGVETTGDGQLNQQPDESQAPGQHDNHAESDNNYWDLDDSATADQENDNSYWDVEDHAGEKDHEGDGDHEDHENETEEGADHDDHDHEEVASGHEEEMGHEEHGDEEHAEDAGHDEHSNDSHDDNGSHDAEEGEDNDAHFTYRLDGSEARVVGFGDLHDAKFKSWARDASITLPSLSDGSATGIPVDGRCSYRVHIYPSQELYDQYNTDQPLIITGIIAIVFLFAIFMFMLYDRIVEHRQKIVLEKAAQSTAIVSSLFPKNVRERLMEENAKGNKQYMGTKSRLKGMMNNAASKEGGGEEDLEHIVVEEAIADLFPACTVFFSDIAGFTAWSSSREPCQVFTLLQTVYQAFDELAKRRRVFKVETIGDSYVAVTGLPDPQERHALIMVRFAFDCMEKFHVITRKLERVLGPDTTELSMRCGLHSGPVTAGVLRGERARFQLFGDTVNTASRMESTGVRGKIQVSESTALLIREAGKEDWLHEREDIVKAKGKGVLKTFWVSQKSKSGESVTSSNLSSSKSAITADSGDSTDLPSPTPKPSNSLPRAKMRLVDWIVQLLVEDVKKLVHARGNGATEQAAPFYKAPENKTCMDEVKDVIQMPEFDSKNADHKEEFRKLEIEKQVVEDLTEFVKGIATRYRGNFFHNFDHACHVTMSVKKLLRRIVKPDLSEATNASTRMSMSKGGDSEGGSSTFNAMAMKIYDYSHGLSSDPLAMFAMTFSALVHDVDHRGISNMQLAVEAPTMADRYKNKSIAEQHSVELAWEILMEDRFANLRQYLFGSQEELMRFRQLVVNIVLATDIFDAELGALRKNRWKQAFEGGGDLLATEATAHDLRATIVIEHIIQASDVSHTMQHWHVYQKWNKCLFKEMYAAFKNGRLAKDPGTFWYKGELGFFDNYIIPLAGKLKQCGVFGVSSDEYLTYARNNRAEWEDCGEEIVAKMLAEVEEEWKDDEDLKKGAAIRREVPE